VSIPPLGGDFQGIGIYRSDEDLEAAEETVPALPFIVSISPPSYPSGWLRPRRARFRFAPKIIVAPTSPEVSTSG
jgi:hypothetical protein